MAEFDPQFDLQIERLIPARPETIWRCWAEPDLFKQWFTPPAVEVVEVENELVPGGRAYNVMKLPDGSLIENDGVFLLADPHSRLVFSDGFLRGFRPTEKPAFMCADIRLEVVAGGTRYHAHVMHGTAEARGQHLEMGFEDGWGITLDQLAELAGRVD